MKVCVYAASSPNIDAIYFEATHQLAQHLVAAQVSVVYGGGATGLMGQLADTVLAEGGQIKGIMPEFMNEVEWGHPKVTEFEYTKTMHQRKAKFLEGIDAIITLPGGTGTLEELLEVITLKRLGILDYPIVILNTQGYYDPLQTMLERCIDQKFLQDKHAQMWQFVHTPEEVLPAIQNSPTWTGGAIDFGK
jgi:uncharacterized protein (TIGR00730 family)